MYSCGRSSAANPAGGAYSAPSDSLAGGGTKNPSLALPRISPIRDSVVPSKKTGVPGAIKIAAKASASLKRLKNTAIGHHRVLTTAMAGMF